MGWAAWTNGHVESGVQDFPLGRGDSPGMRFMRLRAWLQQIIRLTSPEVVVFERAHMRGGFATDLLVGITTRIQEECAAQGIECEALHSATLKKFSTGSGKASKKDMIDIACRRWQLIIKDDNQADALCLLYWALEEHGR